MANSAFTKDGNDGAAGAAGSDAQSAWTIDIGPFLTPAAQSGWSTFGADGNQVCGFYLLTDGSDVTVRSVEWDVVLGAGTWTIAILTVTYLDRAILTFSLDGSDVGTIDTYTGGLLYNQLLTLTSVVVAATGKKRLKVRTGTKNGSSSGYVGGLSGVRLFRTA